MSVTNLTDYQRDPAKYVRRQLEALWKLDADRVALGRLQKAYDGQRSSSDGTTLSSLSGAASVANPTTQPATPPASGPAKEFQ